jgi:pimeloyl-ACP methyl ester carboxylesterase
VPSANARGLVIFAHGSGSSRKSPRNRRVAETFERAGYATLLFDLLTPAEEATDSVTGRLRFDIDLLARRLVGVVDEVSRNVCLGSFPIALFGASTGAAAALVAAAERPNQVRTVVSRGGRPDLAGPALQRVRVPVLLIVGARDPAVAEINREALRALRPPSAIATVPGATHLFDEPGSLEEVARLGVEWLDLHLAPVPA